MITLSHQVWIDAPRTEVYGAIASADRLYAWWDSHEETRRGEAVIWAHRLSRGGALAMRVVERRPDTSVVLECIDAPRDGSVDEEWIGTVLRFNLCDRQDHPPANKGWMQQISGQTILDFTHSGWRADAAYAGLCNATWGMVLMDLKQQCEAAARG